MFNVGTLASSAQNRLIVPKPICANYDLEECRSFINNILVYDEITPQYKYRKLTGGISGAYVFELISKLGTNLILKFYPDSYNLETKQITNIRAIREIITICALSGISGFPCFKTIGYLTSFAQFEMPNKNGIFLITTKSKGVPLNSLDIRGLTKEQAVGISVHLLYLLKQAINKVGASFMHNDLHPDNILVDLSQNILIRLESNEASNNNLSTIVCPVVNIIDFDLVLIDSINTLDERHTARKDIPHKTINFIQKILGIPETTALIDKLNNSATDIQNWYAISYALLKHTGINPSLLVRCTDINNCINANKEVFKTLHRIPIDDQIRSEIRSGISLKEIPDYIKELLGTDSDNTLIEEFNNYYNNVKTKFNEYPNLEYTSFNVSIDIIKNINIQSKTVGIYVPINNINLTLSTKDGLPVFNILTSCFIKIYKFQSLLEMLKLVLMYIRTSSENMENIGFDAIKTLYCNDNFSIKENPIENPNDYDIEVTKFKIQYYITHIEISIMIKFNSNANFINTKVYDLLKTYIKQSPNDPNIYIISTDLIFSTQEHTCFNSTIPSEYRTLCYKLFNSLLLGISSIISPIQSIKHFPEYFANNRIKLVYLNSITGNTLDYHIEWQKFASLRSLVTFFLKYGSSYKLFKILNLDEKLSNIDTLILVSMILTGNDYSLGKIKITDKYNIQINLNALRN